MLRINEGLDEVMAKAVEDLRRPPAFLPDVQQSIFTCYDIERRFRN